MDLLKGIIVPPLSDRDTLEQDGLATLPPFGNPSKNTSLR